MTMLSHRHHEDRPWGSFDQFSANEETTIKIVRVSPGKRLSLQKHTHRAEFWKVIEGDGIAQVGSEERPIALGDEIEIGVGTLHRLTGGTQGCAVLEIAFGAFDEGDIERIEDDFGREQTA
ncbi:MAG: phosphomannose isomerase type II C-terminal cupin domain [Minisyncoccia bacterium]